MDVAGRRREVRIDLVLVAERHFRRPHRPQRSRILDVEAGRDRRQAEVRLREERAGARRRTLRRIPQRLEVRCVERVVIRDPLVSAERSARHVQLEDVVEDAPRPVDLVHAVALDVVREAEARPDLVAEREVNRVRHDRRIVGVRRDVLFFRADAGVDRHPVAQRPGVLDEEAGDVRLHVALGGESGLIRRRTRADDFVITERSLLAVERNAPSQVDRVLETAVDDVVAATIDLEAALDLVRRGARVGEVSGVELEEVASGRIVVDAVVARHVVVAGRVLQIRGHARHSDVGRSVGEREADDVIDVEIVRVGQIPSALRANREVLADDVVRGRGQRPVRVVRALGVNRGCRIGAAQRRQLTVGLREAVVERDARAQVLAELVRHVAGQVLHLHLLRRIRRRRGRDAARVGVDDAIRRRHRRLVRAPEPHLVRHHRPADGGARLDALDRVFGERVVLGLRRHAEHRPQRRRVRARRRGALEVGDRLAVQRVRAALGLHVDDAARRAAVLRRIAGRLDLHFFDEVRQQVLSRLPVEDVGRFDAVDHVAVFARGRAVDHHARRLRLVVRAGRLDDERREVAVVREQLDALRADVGRTPALLDVDDRRLRRHVDLLGDALERQAEFQRLDAAERDDDFSDRERFEARELRRHRVVAGKQRRKPERSRRIGGRRQHAGVGTLRFHGRTGKHAAGCVFHDAVDDAALFLCCCRPREKQGA